MSGFNNWKDAIVSFNNHEKSDVHKFAVQMVAEIPQSVRDIGESMQEGLAAEKKTRAMLRIILQNTKYLARKGLSHRHYHEMADISART